VDLVHRSGELKRMLVQFARSPQFDSELAPVLAGVSPDGVVTDQSLYTTTMDHFMLRYRLPTGTTVVEEFVTAHPELSDAERDMLLGWRDFVESIFEVIRKAGDAVLLLNLVDELTYRTRSNMGGQVFRPLKKGMFIIGRLARAGDCWLISGQLEIYSADQADVILPIAARYAMDDPAATFRNPAKLAQARQTVAAHRAAFMDLFGTDLIVVPGSEVADYVRAFYHRAGKPSGPNAEFPSPELPEDVVSAPGVGIYFDSVIGLCLYPGYNVIDELFRDPALIARRAYRNSLARFLRDPTVPPEPVRRLAARDLASTNKVFTRLLRRKRTFSWEAEGELLLRHHKPGYFDDTMLPTTVTLSPRVAEVVERVGFTR
jgi:hypothetical protein